MQNMSGSQLRESFAFSRRNAVLFCAALLALACALVALAPGQAHAKSYTMPKVDIQAQVETDGALQVTEQRTFDFDGDFSAVWWTFDGLPQNASLKINGVRMANVDADARWWATGRRCRARRSCSAGANRAGLGKIPTRSTRRRTACTCSSTPPTTVASSSSIIRWSTGRRRIPT